MIPLTLGEVATIMGGTLNDSADPTTLVTGCVEFDSRAIKEGDLFLCIPGARVDGHDYATMACRHGAVAVVATAPVSVPAIMLTPRGRVDSNATAYEHDTDGAAAAVIAGVGKLAHQVVSTLVNSGSLTVVGITGSSGKTSTKDLTAYVLATAGAVVCPPGSFNNELGFPWTALRATHDTRFLILEISARGVGHIRQLCHIVAPSIGVVLNVGHAHLGEFGSQATIAQAKAELVEALPSAAHGGVAILNGDDPLVAAMAERTTARIVRYGTCPTTTTDAGPHNTVRNDIYATDISLDELSRPRFTVHMDNAAYHVQLAISGAHNVGNALAVLAVARECGIPCHQAVHAVGEATIVSGRRMEVASGPEGITVINDSYNANPDSMKAALHALSTMAYPQGHPHRGSWAVLGMMAELGESALDEHVALAKVVQDYRIAHLVTVGDHPEMAALARAACDLGLSVETTESRDEAVKILKRDVQPGDVVLVKASQSVGLWPIGEAMVAPPANADEKKDEK